MWSNLFLFVSCCSHVHYLKVGRFKMQIKMSIHLIDCFSSLIISFVFTKPLKLFFLTRPPLGHLCFCHIVSDISAPEIPSPKLNYSDSGIQNVHFLFQYSFSKFSVLLPGHSCSLFSCFYCFLFILFHSLLGVF